MFVTDLTGSVYQAGLDGSRMTEIMLLQGNLTGIAYAEVPGTQPCEQLRQYGADSPYASMSPIARQTRRSARTKGSARSAR
jgi:hypothetical protein